ncbi:wax ester/triacylglycerol synthase family O-acyltransferase [Nocardioidaceae bacterium]|nr:wax ester/triacylglycerol synthase family O-acyltransferase [Nocardioidaceae bacterium]
MARSFLKINDSAWIFADSLRTPMQVGMLATFEVPKDRPQFVADLVERWRGVHEFSAPFNWQLKMLPVPGWTTLEDDEIDLDYHLRHSALPHPGSQRELGVLVSRLHSIKLDRRYPLWEVHVIEGLEENKFALYSKAHHSQVDGVGGIRLLKRMLSADPERREMLPPWAVGMHGPDQSSLPAKPSRREAAVAVATTNSGPASAVKRVVGGLRDGLGDTGEVLGSLAKTYTESATGISDPGRAVPFQAPRTIFNGRIHTPRRFATQQYSIDRMQAVGERTDGSINDVFLAVVGGALRRYLIEQGELPDEPLVANVPVSVRPEGAAKAGNSITFLYATLGTDIEDPIERIRAIRDSTRMGKRRLPSVGGAAMDAYTAVLMAPFLGQAILGFGGRGTPAANVVVSNVPGMEEARYFDGARLQEIYPVSLLFNGQALNITAVSYDGLFNIGFTGCRDSIPSLQRIAVYAGEELAALESALDARKKRRGRAS